MNVQIYTLNPDFVSKELEKGNRYEYVSLDTACENNLIISPDNYDCIFDGELSNFDIDCEEYDDEFSILDALYNVINFGNHPDTYSGHVLSVSDVIVLNDVAYYVDDYFTFCQIEWYNDIPFIKLEDKCNVFDEIFNYSESILKSYLKGAESCMSALAVLEGFRKGLTFALKDDDFERADIIIGDIEYLICLNDEASEGVNRWDAHGCGCEKIFNNEYCDDL